MRSKRKSESDYERLLAQERLILDATETIVALLEERGVSRQELAARLGKSKGFVSQLLSGERNMTLRTLADLGYALGCDFSVVPNASSATPDADTLHALFASFSVSGVAPHWIAPEVVEERQRTIDEGFSVDVHEYELAA
jgi:transcriptional regulator with XRE-family HTH domain